jgi:DNA primase
MDKAGIEALKDANPILDVLAELGVQVQNGRFRCPKPQNHTNGDRTPSVSVWPDRGQFKCWVCPDVKGDVIDLIRLVRGASFREALDFLGRRSGTPLSAPAAGTRISARNPAAPNRVAPRPVAPNPASGSAPASAAEPSLLELSPEAPAAPAGTHRKSREYSDEDMALRQRVLQALLEACPPVGGKVAQYLQKRRVFKRTWDRQRLRMIEDYAGLSRKLEAEFGLADLERTGIFNPAGHLRYYRHKLLFPYFDREGKAVYLQARAIEAEAKPKELSLAGPIPIPYNIRILDGEPGQIYLCEGVIDTLTLIEQGFPAVGIPGASNFKPAWAELFRNKTVHVAFDPDAPGESGAAKAIDLLQAHGIEARRLAPPAGMDLNDWFRKG